MSGSLQDSSASPVTSSSFISGAEKKSRGLQHIPPSTEVDISTSPVGPPPSPRGNSSSEEEEDETASAAAYSLAIQVANGQSQMIQKLQSRIRLLEHDNQKLVYRCAALEDAPLLKTLLETASAQLLEKINAQNAGNLQFASPLTQDKLSGYLWKELTNKLIKRKKELERVDLPNFAKEKDHRLSSECPPGTSDSDSDMMDTSEHTSQEVAQSEDEVMDTEMESTETAQSLTGVEAKNGGVGWDQSLDAMMAPLRILAQMAWNGSRKINVGCHSEKRKGESMRIEPTSKLKRVGDIEEIPTETVNTDQDVCHRFMDGWDIDGRRTTRSMVRSSDGQAN